MPTLKLTPPPAPKKHLITHIKDQDTKLYEALKGHNDAIEYILQVLKDNQFLTP